MRAVVALVAPLFLVLAACGDDDDGGGDAAPFVEAVSDDIQSGDDEEFSLDADSADCVAASIVDAVGVEQLEDEGIEPDELAEADSFDDLGISLDDDAIDGLGNALDDCDLAGNLIDGFVAASGLELSAEAASCLEDATADELGPAIAAGFVDDEASGDFEALFVDAFGACPAATAELFAAGIEQELGSPLSDEALNCITEQVEADPEGAAQAFAGSESTGQEIGEQIGLACMEHFAG